ncbi:unnamed protein product [Cylindrotheca closterium]|uniref:Uncharacterized protein n=1 Tax=Cylindrotheca closterium TaxID=2856 RepID=A0AAD2CHD3_9STRA|nr:unnamed protein product [Cylindrotheca closterium]
MSSYFYEVYKIKKSLDNLGKSPVKEDGEVDGKDSDKLVTKFNLLPFILVALGVVGVAGVVMIISALFIVDVSSALIIGIGFLAVWQKGKLARLGGVRGNINKLRAMVNEMTLENDKLTASNDKFQLENDKLSYVTRDIESLATTMGIGVDRLNSSIEEFDAITKEMNHCLEQQVMQQVMDIVLKTDRNQDFHIKEPRELKRLEQRLSNMPNVEFHEENFRRITRYDDEDAPGIKVGDIMAMFRNLKDPSVDPKDNIFILRPDEEIRKQYVEKRESGVYEQRRGSAIAV